MFVLDRVEQAGDIATAQLRKRTVANQRQYVDIELAFDFSSGAQAAGVDVALHPLRSHVGDKVRLDRGRLERIQALPGAPDRFAGLLPGRFDCQHVGAADRGPGLPALVASDCGVDHRTRHRDAQVHAALFGIGQDVALGFAGQRGNLLVSERLAALPPDGLGEQLLDHEETLGLTKGYHRPYYDVD